VPERNERDMISEILNRVRALESVLVSREISDATKTLDALQAEVRELNSLGNLRAALGAQLAELQGRADALLRAGEPGGRYQSIQESIARVKVDLQEVEARIDSAERRQSKSARA
jgi:alkylation response protein AidB-like acyl-CoA dehydrogenase